MVDKQTDRNKDTDHAKKGRNFMFKHAYFPPEFFRPDTGAGSLWPAHIRARRVHDTKFAWRPPTMGKLWASALRSV